MPTLRRLKLNTRFNVLLQLSVTAVFTTVHTSLLRHRTSRGAKYNTVCRTLSLITKVADDRVLEVVHVPADVKDVVVVRRLPTVMRTYV